MTTNLEEIMLDLTKTRDAHIDERLRSNIMIWLNTVRADGRPHSAAVWFLWDGKAFLIFSRPNNQKIRNLRQNSNVLLALDDTKNGSDVIQVRPSLSAGNSRFIGCSPDRYQSANRGHP
jgi:PPOX class probable F420-dependent enzyme